MTQEESSRIIKSNVIMAQEESSNNAKSNISSDKMAVKRKHRRKLIYSAVVVNHSLNKKSTFYYIFNVSTSTQKYIFLAKGSINHNVDINLEIDLCEAHIISIDCGGLSCGELI